MMTKRMNLCLVSGLVAVTVSSTLIPMMRSTQLAGKIANYTILLLSVMGLLLYFYPTDKVSKSSKSPKGNAFAEENLADIAKRPHGMKPDLMLQWTIFVPMMLLFMWQLMGMFADMNLTDVLNDSVRRALVLMVTFVVMAAMIYTDYHHARTTGVSYAPVG